MARGFLDAYRAAFEAFDPAAIADLFTYPCAIISDASEAAVTVVPSREAWIPRLERLIEAYRALGVRWAEPVTVKATELGSRLVQLTVHWRLMATDATPLYEFDAAYTLADRGAGFRVAAIAHNETPRLRAAIEGRPKPSSQH